MSEIHLTLEGNWEVCSKRTKQCAKAVHVPDLSPEEAKNIPMRLLDTLIETYDPPTNTVAGMKQWRDEQGRLHRDYNLPAVIRDNGLRTWFTRGIWQKQSQ